MNGDRADFGARLRAAREGRGLSLKDVSNATKISGLVLGALERNDVSRLPGGLFSRAIVRAYAKEVGLDPERTVREFSETFSSEDEAARADEPVRTRRSSGDFEAASPASALKWLGLTITLLLVVVWVGINRYQRTDERAAATATRQEAAPRPPAGPALPKPTTVPAEPAAGNLTPQSSAGQPPPPIAGQAATAPRGALPQPAAQAPGATAQAPPPGAVTGPGAPAVGVDPSLPLQIVLTPRSACWVSATVDGNRVVGRTLQAGEKVHLSAAKSVVLTAGDAAALSYTVNNAAGRPLGGSGQVATIVVTPSNYSTFLAGRQ